MSLRLDCLLSIPLRFLTSLVSWFVFLLFAFPFRSVNRFPVSGTPVSVRLLIRRFPCPQPPLLLWWALVWRWWGWRRLPVGRGTLLTIFLPVIRVIVFAVVGVDVTSGPFRAFHFLVLCPPRFGPRLALKVKGLGPGIMRPRCRRLRRPTWRRTRFILSLLLNLSRITMNVLNRWFPGPGYCRSV